MKEMWRYKHWQKEPIPGNTGEWRYTDTEPPKDDGSIHAIQKVVGKELVLTGYQTIRKDGSKIILSLDDYNIGTPLAKDHWKDAEPIFGYVWIAA